MDITNPRVTIIIPVYNGASTLNSLFKGLERQINKDIVEKIILINDCSTDGSHDVIKEYRRRSSYPIEYIRRERSWGLAANYNDGILRTSTDLFIILHQDIDLIESDSIQRMIKEVSTPQVVVAIPVIQHPYEIWKEYSFWQKCLFSRDVGRDQRALAGKFDCYVKHALLDEIGLFDSDIYRTAGEDGDMKARIRMRGLKIAETEVRVVHLHSKINDFTLSMLLKKEAQYHEARGAYLRKHGIRLFTTGALSPVQFCAAYFRQLLLSGLLLPYVRVLSFFLIVIYTFLYTKHVYLEEYKDKRILALPLINIYLLFVSLFYSIKGFVTGRQQI